MMTIAEAKSAYRAIMRADLPDAETQKAVHTIDSLESYIDALLEQTLSTTQSAVAVVAFLEGRTPTSGRLDALKSFTDAQFSSYEEMGVADPALGPFEAIGKAFAADQATGFATKYASVSEPDFINQIYAEVNATDPSDEVIDEMSAQIAQFTDLYMAADLPDPSTQAKGAVLGHMIGRAFVYPHDGGTAQIKVSVAAMLSMAAKGSSDIYNAPLPLVTS